MLKENQLEVEPEAALGPKQYESNTGTTETQFSLGRSLSFCTKKAPSAARGSFLNSFPPFSSVRIGSNVGQVHSFMRIQ